MSFSILVQSVNITCDHCINTIKDSVDQINNITFISGDAENKSFIVNIEKIDSLHDLVSTLKKIDYPLNDFKNYDSTSSSNSINKSNWSPEIKIKANESDQASVHYSCHCGCDIELLFNRQNPIFNLQDCCCGTFSIIHPSNSYKHIQTEISAKNISTTFEFINIENIAMPWGQPVQLSIAIQKDK